VDVPLIEQDYSRANGGGGGLACTNPASTSGARKPSVARSFIVLVVISCLLTSVLGRATPNHRGTLELGGGVGTAPSDALGRDQDSPPPTKFGFYGTVASLPLRVMKRDVKCKFFRPDGNGVNTTSSSTKVSPAVDCRQAGSPCVLSAAKGQTASYSSQFYLNTGEVVKGVDVEASFGSTYRESYSSAVIYTTSVPVGQCGFLQSYSFARLFNGTYISCSDGSDKAGKALVVVDKLQLSSLVMTSC